MHGAFSTYYLDDAQGIWLLGRSHHHDHVLLVINIGYATQVVALPAGAWQTMDGAIVSETLAAPARVVTTLLRAP
jgi:hypothetical protein